MWVRYIIWLFSFSYHVLLPIFTICRTLCKRSLETDDVILDWREFPLFSVRQLGKCLSTSVQSGTELIWGLGAVLVDQLKLWLPLFLSSVFQNAFDWESGRSPQTWNATGNQLCFSEVPSLLSSLLPHVLAKLGRCLPEQAYWSIVYLRHSPSLSGLCLKLLYTQGYVPYIC